jgi:hypothetical protein
LKLIHTLNSKAKSTLLHVPLQCSQVHLY